MQLATELKLIQMFESSWESDSWRKCPGPKGLQGTDDGEHLVAKLRMAVGWTGLGSHEFETPGPKAGRSMYFPFAMVGLGLGVGLCSRETDEHSRWGPL